MQLNAIVCSVLAALVLIVVVSAQDEREETQFLYPYDDCSNVQSFQVSRSHFLLYEGTISHKDVTRNETKSGFRIKCTNILLSVLSPCAARLQLSECSLYEGSLDKNGELLFEDLSPKSRKFAFILKRFPAYFFFNSGEVKDVFFHKNEPVDVANIKRAILSSVSLKFSGKGFANPIGESFTVNSTSLFGTGDQYMTVTAHTRRGIPKEIESRRYLSAHHLPWNKNAALRMSRFDNNKMDDVYLFFTNQIEQIMNNAIGSSKPTQLCRYHLQRGRRIHHLTCTEEHFVPIFQNFGNRNAMSTSVTQYLKIHRISSLKAKDRMSPTEAGQLESYQKQTLVFQTELDALTNDLLNNFDPKAAFFRMIDPQSSDENLSVLSKLSLWASNQNEESIQNLWAAIVESIPIVPETVSAWNTLLLNCMDSKWCHLEKNCTRSLGCQQVYSHQVSLTVSQPVEEDIKLLLLSSLASVKNPGSAILQTALNVALTDSTSSKILTLGQVLNRHLTSEVVEKSNDTIEEVKEFLLEVVHQKCSLETFDKEDEKSALYAIKSLPLLLEDQSEAANVWECAHNPNAPKSVKIAAIQAMNNKQVITSPQIRKELLQLMIDKSKTSDLRLPSFLILLAKEPNDEEIYKMLALANDPSESAGIKYFLNKYIKSQIALFGTDYSTFSKITMDRFLDAFASVAPNLEQPMMGENKVEKKSFEQKFPVELPILKQNIGCFFKADMFMSGNNPIPLVIEVSIHAELQNANVSLLNIKVDIGQLTTVLPPLFGVDGVLPLQAAEHLMNIPVYQWLRTFDVIPPKMPDDSFNKLEQLSDQFRLAKLMLETQNKAFLEIKFMGQGIALSSILQSTSIQDMTISQMLKYVEKLENGMFFNGSIVMTPVHFQTVLPTSVGLGVVSSVDIATMLRPAFSVLLEINKLVFTGRGSAKIHLDPTVEIQINMDRTIKVPRGCSCGSGVLVKAKHDSQLQIKITKNPSSIEMEIYPSERNDLLMIRSASTSSTWGTPTGVEITSAPLSCRTKTFYPGGRYFSTECGEQIAPREVAYWHNPIEVPIKYQLSWGPMPGLVNQQPLPAVGIELVVSAITDLPIQASFTKSWSFRYFPTINQIQVSQINANTSVWEANANLVIELGTGSNSQQIQQVFASANASMTGQNIFEGSLVVDKSTGNVPLEDVLTTLNMQGELQYGSVSGYDVTGTVVLPTAMARFVAVGHIPQPTISGEFTALGKLYVGSPNGPSIGTIVWEREVVTEGIDVGSRMKILLKELSPNFFPYESVNMTNTMINSSTTGYKKILHLDSTYHPSFPGPFLDLRQITKYSSIGDPRLYDWKASVTSNYFQAQWSADATDSSRFDIRSHLVLPVYPIAVDQIRSSSHDDVRIPILDPTVVTYGLDVTLGTLPEGHINTTAFYNILGVKQFVQLTSSHVNCKNCFVIEAVTLQGEGKFIFKYQNSSLWTSFYLNIDPEIAEELHLPSTLYSSLSSGRVKIGYDFIAHFKPDSFDVQVGTRIADYFCTLDEKLSWNKANLLLSSKRFGFSLGLICETKVSDAINALDFHYDSQIDYELAKTNSDSSRRINVNSYMQKSNLMTFNQSLDVSVDSSSSVLQEAALITDTTYSLSESEINEAVTNKRGQGNFTLTYLDPVSDTWLSPTHGVKATWSEPSMPLSPGGADNRYHHDGKYFIGPPQKIESTLQELCGRNNNCKDRKRQIYQKRQETSLQKMLRLAQFSAEEQQRFTDIPWMQLGSLAISKSNSIFAIHAGSIMDTKDIVTYIHQKMEKILSKFDGNLDDSYISELEGSLIMVQHFLENLAETIPLKDYNIGPIKVYIESLFEKIFKVDYALGNILQNPLSLPPHLFALREQMNSLLDSSLLLSTMDLYQSVGFFYPTSAQYITVNGHYHVFPQISQPSCNWLSGIDTKEGLVTAALKRDSTLMSFNGTTLVTHRNGMMDIVDPSGNSLPVEFPFIFATSICRKNRDNEIECGNDFSSTRFTFDMDNNQATLYADVRGSYMDDIKGLAGIAGNKIEVPRYLLPDGSVGKDEAEFLNHYELTGNDECLFKSEDAIVNTPTETGMQLCSQAFEHFVSFDLMLVNTYMKMCSEKATTPNQVCKYVEMLVHSMRRRGYAMPTFSMCSECSSDQPIEITRVNIMIMISRSSDMLTMNPTDLLLDFVSQLLQEHSEAEVINADIILVTYGGPTHFYQPFINTIGQQTKSNDVARIRNRITQIEFNGPSYDSTSSVDALDFALKLNEAHLGVARSVIVVAPESTQQHMGGRIPKKMANLFINQLTNVYLLSSLNDQECMTNYIMLPHLTSGDCHRSDDSTSLVNAVRAYLIGKMRSPVSCTCGEIDQNASVCSQII
ncbi:unnamed protein product [Clavelina lepadiformis]|uniref:Vitellogenin domain-containing protein n=1 Tax=Clavelina lepadiformis TaxID=159417 RepID=A0ABP0EXR0_CLALP